MAYLPLSTANLPDPVIDPAQGSSPEDYFGVDTYAGTSATHERSELNFQPDFVWTKNRTGTNDHQLVDAVRGNTKALRSNDVNSEDTFTNGILSFDSDGVTLGSNSRYNATSNNYVSWNWKANGSATLNDQGTIDSQVSANTTSGFSIVSYTGNSTENTTYSVGHGLSETPDMVIIKNRDWASSSKAWAVWHSSISTGGVYLDDTDISEANNFNYFFATQPNSTTFSVRADSTVSSGNRYRTNGGYAYIAYCFHSVEGFSKFGSYTGNGTADDGPFVYTGFRPAFVLLKASTVVKNWIVVDTARDIDNTSVHTLFPHSSSTEFSGDDRMDMLSNGFKIRGEASSDQNLSGETFIYMAFAENPFKYSNAR